MSVHKVSVAVVLAMLLGLGAGLGAAQVFQSPQPVPWKVFEAPDVAFRVEAIDPTTNTPVGQLLVKVNGKWVEARIDAGGGVKKATAGPAK